MTEVHDTMDVATTTAQGPLPHLVAQVHNQPTTVNLAHPQHITLPSDVCPAAHGVLCSLCLLPSSQTLGALLLIKKNTYG